MLKYFLAIVFGFTLVFVLADKCQAQDFKLEYTGTCKATRGKVDQNGIEEVQCHIYTNEGDTTRFWIITMSNNEPQYIYEVQNETKAYRIIWSNFL